MKTWKFGIISRIRFRDKKVGTVKRWGEGGYESINQVKYQHVCCRFIITKGHKYDKIRVCVLYYLSAGTSVGIKRTLRGAVSLILLRRPPPSPGAPRRTWSIAPTWATSWGPCTVTTSSTAGPAPWIWINMFCRKTSKPNFSHVVFVFLMIVGTGFSQVQ